MGACTIGRLALLLGRFRFRPIFPRVPESRAGRLRIYLFGGKGGTGKTTCAAAWALGQADQGKQVLLISTDPAHSLGDVMGQHIHRVKPWRLTDHLWAQELSAERALRHYQVRLLKQFRQVTNPDLWSALKNQVQKIMTLPGAQEAALLDAIAEIVDEANSRRRWDVLVFDTAPTGHTLVLVQLPELIGIWSEGLMNQRLLSRDDASEGLGFQPDHALELLEQRRARMSMLRKLLTDQEVSRFIWVMRAERLAIEETNRALGALKESGMHVERILINGIFARPEHDVFWLKRWHRQNERVAEIRRRFSAWNLQEVPLMDEDVIGLEALRRLQGIAKMDNFFV